jgi:UDPglucose 6-dehydrogenase
MSDVGVLGLGKLGLIMAMVLDVHGNHRVTGCDFSRRPTDILTGQADAVPKEADILHLIANNHLNVINDPASLVANADVIFVAVQTPHPPAYDGTVPVPEETKDFDYSHLISAVRQLSRAADQQCKFITIAVVSTVLPGTCDRLLRPLLSSQVKLVYTPSLIALGKVADDLLNPEFVILGTDSYDDALPVRQIYASLHSRPVLMMSIPSAELTKVAYNTYTSMKIVFANTMLEIAEKTGADADAVTDALSQATVNLMSPKYLRGGMGGGGYCHPRDVIAMSYLADRLDLSSDLFGFLAHAREAQSMWLASVAQDMHYLTDLPVVILGNAYRPNSDLAGGSAALLLFTQLSQFVPLLLMIDPYTGDQTWDEVEKITDSPCVFVIGCAHREFARLEFEPGSVVIDPSGIIPDQPGVTVIRLGRKL